MARPRRQQRTSTGESPETFECPECGRRFDRAASLGAHRQRAHGVAGKSKRGRQQTQQRTTRRAGRARGGRRRGATPAGASDGQPRASVDRNALLEQLFPAGIPPRDDVVRRVNVWLDEAEELAALK